MPPALDVDWAQVRMLAVQVGVREAARQLGLSVDAVRQRSAREKWLADLPRSQPLPPTVLQRVVSNVTSPPEVQRNILVAIGQETRENLAKGLAKGAEHVKSLSGSAVLAKANNIGALAKSAALVHGWESSPTVSLRLDLVAANEEIKVSGRVIDAETGQISDDI